MRTRRRGRAGRRSIHVHISRGSRRRSHSRRRGGSKRLRASSGRIGFRL